MKGKTLEEFIEQLNYGCEMHFLYNNRSFIIQNEFENGIFQLRINEYDVDMTGKKDLYEKIVFGLSFEDCAKKILAESFIDDKTLFEIEQDITVIIG